MSRVSLLVVEDHPLQQRLYEAMAKKLDFELTIVPSCCEAIEQLTAQGRPMVLMDLSLADVDGCECTRQIRELDQAKGRHTTIVAVSGSVTDDYRTKCTNAGMDDFMGKPFSVQQLRELIEKWTAS